MSFPGLGKRSGDGSGASHENRLRFISGMPRGPPLARPAKLILA